MQPENAIEVRDLTKKFKVFYDKGNQLKEKILFHNRNRYENRWVLNGISFNVRRGEAVGLIGHNGCGKSTTLKLLTKIIYPDSGTIEMRGRVSSLIELGAGFHPDMSGRENIYTNAPFSDSAKRKSMRVWRRSSNSPSWRNLLTTQCAPIPRVCICVWRSRWRSMWMRIFC